ncbi:hypothetical protein N9C84_01460 [Desulfobacterales bacterium]|nr:hypothetical protein [Desulfobacterales bacterium]
MKNKKKIAAASAVLAYIKEEEEIAGAMAMQAQAGARETQALERPQTNMWGLNGRQAQMQLRSMMQLKAFHGVRHS